MKHGGKPNQTGYIGIDLHKSGKYRVRKYVKGKGMVHCGLFESIDEALKAHPECSKLEPKEQPTMRREFTKLWPQFNVAI